MDAVRSGQTGLRVVDAQGFEMLQPDEVAAMLSLHEHGWGAKWTCLEKVESTL